MSAGPARAIRIPRQILSIQTQRMECSGQNGKSDHAKREGKRAPVRNAAGSIRRRAPRGYLAGSGAVDAAGASPDGRTPPGSNIIGGKPRAQMKTRRPAAHVLIWRDPTGGANAGAGP